MGLLEDQRTEAVEVYFASKNLGGDRCFWYGTSQVQYLFISTYNLLYILSFWQRLYLIYHLLSEIIKANGVMMEKHGLGQRIIRCSIKWLVTYVSPFQYTILCLITLRLNLCVLYLSKYIKRSLFPMFL